LDLLHLLLELHSHQELLPYLEKATEAVVQSVAMDGEEALSVRPLALHALASIARRLPQEGAGALVNQVYESTLSQLTLKDTAQQVKVAAIATMAVLLGRFGDRLQGLNERVLLVFGERLRNDSTREATLQALIKISTSETRCDLSSLVQSEAFISDLCSFMRQASMELKRYTVLCLEAIVRTHHAQIGAAKFADVLNEVAPHISDADLTLSHHVLDLVTTSLKVSAKTAPQVSKDILQRTIAFLNSPLLQGVSLLSTITFFQACVLHGGKVQTLSYDALLQSLLGIIKCSPGASKSVFSAVSQCIAGVTDAEWAAATVAAFVDSVKQPATPDAERAIALLSVGEIGRKFDASGQKGIDGVIVSAFESEAPFVRDAAAFALGNLAVGNTAQFLPTILRLIEQRPEQQYLLLCSLKETIVSHSVDARLRAVFMPHLAKVTPLLFARAESDEEETRTVVASCLGRLAIVDPAKLLPALRTLLTSKSEALREVVITALRSSFQPGADWAYLSGAFLDFFALLKDPSLHVRHQVPSAFCFCFCPRPSALGPAALTWPLSTAAYHSLLPVAAFAALYILVPLHRRSLLAHPLLIQSHFRIRRPC
jgi:cullin-associated NEDD8-dissociated protein 1